jgi:hypothetical protein
MPDFPKNTNTANMKGSEFFGFGNQKRANGMPYASPVKHDSVRGKHTHKMRRDMETNEPTIDVAVYEDGSEGMVTQSKKKKK